MALHLSSIPIHHTTLVEVLDRNAQSLMTEE
jgi:hypothetical protein